MDGPVWSIVVAAGSGSRFGGRKQLASIGGETMAAMALRSLSAVSDGVVVVLPDDLSSSKELSAELAAALSGGSAGAPPLLLAVGRETRAGSVRAGLELVPEECEIVLVHDAARPLASPDLARRVVTSLRSGALAVVPAVGLRDTVKRVAEGRVVETVPRHELVSVQTPQGFEAGVLKKAHAGCGEATDDAGLVEASGVEVLVVEGEPWNIKVTSREDLELASWWSSRRFAEQATPARGLL